MAANSYSPAVGDISDESASCFGVRLGADSVAGCGQWQLVYLRRILEKIRGLIN